MNNHTKHSLNISFISSLKYTYDVSNIDLSEIRNKKTALVLSGGVAKAASWHLGVALALEDLGFSLKNNKNYLDTTNKKPLEISTFVGSSAGAMISIFLAAGFTPQDVLNATLGIDNAKMKPITYRDMFHLGKSIKPAKSEFYHPFDEMPAVTRALLKPLLNFSGFFSTEGLRKYLIKNVIEEDTFESFKPDLFIVGTQLDHSRKVIFSKYNYPNPSHDSTAIYYTGVSVSEAAAASMSVPPFFTPYPIRNNITNQMDYYIDGEIRETLSTHVADDNHCDVIISSWTHTPYHFHDEVGSLVNYGLPAIAIQSIYLMIQKKIVTARATRATAHDIIDTVNDYMKTEKFSEKQRKELTNILARKLNVKTKVKLIDIYPDHHDYKLFFGNSFSLNPKTASYTVRRGYKRTMEIMGHQS
jgi:predicted acylesterase/phospholipase RssA